MTDARGSGDNAAIVRRFLADLGRGAVDTAIFAPDMTAWASSRPQGIDRASYVAALEALAPIARGRLDYAPHTVTSEGDRVVAEVRCEGVLPGGARYGNDYVFSFRLHDGAITHIAEYFDPAPVREVLLPAVRAARRTD